MSGTSLDGVDLACCHFSDGGDSKRLKWSLMAAETIQYSDEWTQRLSTLEKASAFEYALADVDLGHLYGQIVKAFVDRHNLKVDYVASHGHTVFHQPHLKLTTQIGDGDSIAAECGLPVVFNFRRMDVALGGQGAPLVPIGDQLLFAEYDACLNLGGIANISYGADMRIAFDICPCNMALNLLSRKVGKSYDRDGDTARTGKIIEPLLGQLEKLEYYTLPAPKSLGKEWFAAEMQPLIDNNEHDASDMLRTIVEHIATQIATVVNSNNIHTLLATGGGAKNKLLIERLSALAPDCKVTVPQADIIDYKEAIIFALLGYLRLTMRPNCLQSVTGAAYDCIGGNLSGICHNKVGGS